jgi:5'-nucleotidase
MPEPSRLTVAIASSALFDLAESDAVFRAQGTEVYREYQRRNANLAATAAPLVHVPFGVVNPG